MKNKKHTTMLAASGLLAVSLTALGVAQSKGPASDSTSAASVKMPKTDRMPMAEFKKLLASNEVVVVDVRSNDNYIAGHIPGALSIPEGTINAATAEKLKKLGRPIATYCS